MITFFIDGGARNNLGNTQQDASLLNHEGYIYFTLLTIHIIKATSAIIPNSIKIHIITPMPPLKSFIIK